MTTEKRECICFAYYGDGNFLGWYADSFGSIRNCPKIYGNTEHQKEVITKNFSYKLSKVGSGEPNSGDLITQVNPAGGALLSLGLRGDEAILAKYKEIELRVVSCPEYDGPNPNHVEGEKDWWIYADYKKVKEWAANEPTEFLETIKPQ